MESIFTVFLIVLGLYVVQKAMSEVETYIDYCVWWNHCE
jgi:hypothetical protein